MFGNFLQEIIAQGPSSVGGIPGLPGTGAVAPTSTDWVSGLTNLGIMVGIVLIPFFLSKLLSSKLKMPTHMSAFYWIFLSIFSTSLVLILTLINPAQTKTRDANGVVEKPAYDTGFKLKWGPEIVGGTNLIYEIDRSTEGKSKVKVLAKDFMYALAKRLNPSGTKELLIRPIGDDQINHDS